MRKSFVFTSVFAKMSLFAFLMCMAFVSCGSNGNKKTETPKPKEDDKKDIGSPTEITMENFETLLKDDKKINDYLVVDVRRDQEKEVKGERKGPEYQKGHTFCAISIPFDEAKHAANADDPECFDSKLIDGMKDKNLIIQCRTDNRSQKVWKILKKRGFKNVDWVYGASAYPTKEHKDGERADKKHFNKENFSKIPAILQSQIKDITGVVVVDVRKEEDFNKAHYDQAVNLKDEEAVKAYTMPAGKTVVVMGYTAIDAYKAAKVLENKLGLKESDFVKNLYICVRPYEK